MNQIHRYLWSTLALAFVLSLGTAAHATTYVVGGCSADPDLQGPDAIQVVLGDYNPTPLIAGDTISVCGGSTFYGGNVIYTDDITIKLAPKAAESFVSCAAVAPATVDSSDIGFLVLAQNVTIQGLNIASCDVGVLGDPEGNILELNDLLPTLNTPFNIVHPGGFGPFTAHVDPAWQSKKGKGKKHNNNCPTHDVDLCVNKDVFNYNEIGVFTYSVPDADIENNLFIDNLAGVFMLDSFTSVVKNNKITGYNDVTSEEFDGSFGIIDLDGEQDVIANNKVVGAGVGIGLEALYTGTTQASVKDNTTTQNAMGLEVDIIDAYFGYTGQQSSLNKLTGNTSKNNMPPGSAVPYITGDCGDATTGGGTVGTANTWKSDKCGTSVDVSGKPL
jgi:hypothetical protein